jgi:hypothetical protein
MVKKAHLVTGKGGVGKSLFSAVLAYRLSLENQHILLTELTEQSFFRDYLNLGQINYKPINWKPGLDVSQWSPEDCLKEYSLHLLKIESLYRIFIENPVSKSLIQVAPGLHELALLGKLTSSPRKHGPPMDYDQIVVDSFSTGHFLGLLRAPAALNEAVPFGPMGEQSKGIDSWIRDGDFTQVHIVCLPEELPVTESIELYTQLKKEFGIKSHFYLNKLWNISESDLAGLPASAAESLTNTVNSEAAARRQLNEAGISFTELPQVASLDPEEIIKKLAAIL